MKRKVFILGLDGGCWNILNSLMSRGRMPNLTCLKKGGASGILKSTVPPLTPPAWASFQTGVNPGKHGIFNFFKYDPQANISRLVSSRELKINTIWELAGKKGKKVGAVNVPLTYPPRKINGFLIGGVMTPGTHVQFTYPPGLYSELRRAIGDYQIYVNPKDFYDDPPEKFVDRLIYVEQKRLEASLYLMNEYGWDLFMLHNQSMDVLQHLLWAFLDSSHPEFKEAQWKIVSRFYDSVDSHIGEIIQRLDSSTTLIIISDHGFGSLERTINLSRWLQEQGVLVLKGVNELRRPENLPGLMDILRQKKEPGFFNRENVAVKKHLNLLVDWSRTKAFIPQTGIYGFIRLNCKGRELNGIISPQKEFEQVSEELSQKLMQLKDPSNGKNVVEKVLRKEDVYQGPMLPLSPDLIVKPGKGYAFVQKLDGENDAPSKTSVEHHRGTHREEGIFLFHGNSVKRSEGLRAANIMDVAPTVLHLLDIEVPEYMDGRILKDIVC